MASSATSRAGSYISGTSSGRNRADVDVPERLGDLAACRHRRLSGVERDRAQRLFGRGDVLLARTRGKRRRRGHDHPRIAILQVRAHQPGNLLAPAGGQRTHRRGPHLRVIVFQHLLDASRPPGLQVRARRFDRAQRAGADLGRGVVEEQRRDQVPPVEALEQIDRMQHMPRVRMPEFLDERLDREQVGARMPQVLRLHVLRVEAPPEGTM